MIIFPIIFTKLTSFLYFEYMKNLFLFIAKCGISLVVPFVITSFLVSANYIFLVIVAVLSALSYALCAWVILLNKNDREYFTNSLLSIIGKA
jgi:hypothetical protein